MRDAKLIQSRDNALFKTLLKFSKSSHERRKQGITLLDGPHLVETFDHSGHEIDILALNDSGAMRPELSNLFDRVRATQKIRLSDRLFQDIAPVHTPTGILAVVKTPKPQCAPDPAADAVLLEAIQDPGNLGSILRSAAASGVRQVLLSHGSAFAWSPKVLRAGMGAHFALRIFEDCDLAEFVRHFEGSSIAMQGKAEQSLFDISLKTPVAWLFGNEGAGLSNPLASLATFRVRIPMCSEAESLNVAAAAAVCFFERLRQAY
ncbi:MAG TPA: RNA methyltransferase [Burkholderiales bacterium]|nr:RNA methyltransferase [Burkholderiales bacterium]